MSRILWGSVDDCQRREDLASRLTLRRGKRAGVHGLRRRTWQRPYWVFRRRFIPLAEIS